MILIKNSLLCVLAFLLIFSLRAEKNSELISQAPPFIIYSSDTSKVIFPKLKSEKLPVSTFEIVEDTLLPPCDVIFFKSGKLDYCKIIETTPTTITYKMCDYQDGPNVVISKSDVHKIRYANGREEVIIPSSQQNQLNAYVKARKDPMATWALIASLGGLLFAPASIAAVILGIISLNRIKKSEGRLRGKGAARAAIIIGGIIILLTILLYI